MKKFALLLSFVFAAGVASVHASDAAKAQAEVKSTSTTHSHAAKSSMKVHKVEAEVISTDLAAKTITIKGEGENKTAPVEGKAVSALKNVKPGQMWTLTCRDNEKGEHQAVIGLAKAPAVKKTAAK